MALAVTPTQRQLHSTHLWLVTMIVTVVVGVSLAVSYLQPTATSAYLLDSWQPLELNVVSVPQGAQSAEPVGQHIDRTYRQTELSQSTAGQLEHAWQQLVNSPE